MSKYAHGVFFASPYSNISPPSTSFDMARSSSRDSAISMSQYPTSHPLSRGSSTSSYQPTSAPMRRTSSSSSTSSQSTWIASPYRSCLNRHSSFDAQEPTSYLSDDELLCLTLPVESIPNPCIKKNERKELTTEEQIEHLREIQAQEEREERQRRDSTCHSSSRRKTVRFEPEVQRKPSRPSIKRRSTACRNHLRTLNGPM